MSAPYTLGSLFTGIGGIDLAFVRAGFSVSFQVEIDDYCRKVLAKHAPEYWPTAQVFEDVKHVGSANLPNVDVLAGGFPCQDISAAGKRAGIKEGTRSGLWFEFARIIGEIRPRIVMLENVAAITSRDGVRVIADLASLGYDAEWGIIPASAVGAPHRRERWWCVAYVQSNGNLRERCCQAATQGASQDDGAKSDCSSSTMVDSNNTHSASANDTLCAGWNPIDDASLAVGVAHCDNEQARSAYRMGTQPKRQAQGKQPLAYPGWGKTQSVMDRVPDGVSRQLDNARWPSRPGQPQAEWEPSRTTTSIAHRGQRLKALGNAVVPAVVQPIAEAIYFFLQEASSQECSTKDS